MPLNTIQAAMTTGLLKTANNLSELATAPATQEAAADNLGINYALPVGSIIAWSKNIVPAGYLLCNGSAVSRTTYADLFNLIGTAYGSGNGTTTFNVPNVTGGFTVSTGTIYYLIKYDYVSGLPPA